MSTRCHMALYCCQHKPKSKNGVGLGTRPIFTLLHMKLGGGGVISLSDIDRKLVVVCIKYGIFNIVFLLHADTQLTEYPVKESEVLKQLNLVTISKREVEVVSKYFEHG